MNHKKETYSKISNTYQDLISEGYNSSISLNKEIELIFSLAAVSFEVRPAFYARVRKTENGFSGIEFL
ncbi:hypothetical protein N9W79_01930, partial [bacterium]|nr:hypothetical protein [bacterium]